MSREVAIVELRGAAVNAGDAVADIGRQSLLGFEPDGGHSEVSVVGVIRGVQQRIGPKHLYPASVVRQTDRRL